MLSHYRNVLYLVRRDIVSLWSGILGVIRRKIRETVNVLLFPFHLISTQRYFLSSRIFIDHLPHAKFIIMLVKILPSVLHFMGTAIFATFFTFNTMSLKVDPQIGFRLGDCNLPLIGLGVDLVHLLALTFWVLWADPQHIRTLTDERILLLLLRMDQVPAQINLTCSRNATDFD